MQFCSVVSGSSGNCLFVREKDTRLLIDCGLSGKSTKSGLFFNGIDIADIDGVLITHERLCVDALSCVLGKHHGSCNKDDCECQDENNGDEDRTLSASLLLVKLSHHIEAPSVFNSHKSN